MKLSGVSRVLRVSKLKYFYCISVADTDKTYQILIRLNESDFTVTKHRVLANISQCEFFGELPTDSDELKTKLTPLICYLD